MEARYIEPGLLIKKVKKNYTIILGGIRAFHFWKHDFELWIGGFGLDSGHVPTSWGWFWVHVRKFCPCEASEQKMGQKPKAKRNETELSFLHYSICLDELIILEISNVKIGWEMAELCRFKVGTKVASWPIWGWKLAILAIFFEI